MSENDPKFDSESLPPAQTTSRPAAIPLQVLRAWWYRMLKDSGPAV
jgi:hypothetical protein